MITREQRDEIERLAQNIGDTVTATHRSYAWDEMHNYLDTLVAEPAEQATRESERAALVAEVGDCCGGGDPLCGGGCLAGLAAAKRAGRLTMTAHQDDEARLHADDARAAMAAFLANPRDHGIQRDEQCAGRAHELADAMQIERKRRQG